MLIKDLSQARPEEIDLKLIELKLWGLRRFQGHPAALCVRPHTMLARRLAERDGASDEVIQWAYHHDDHEALTGDAHGLLLRKVREHTPVWDDVSDHLDKVICEARGIEYPVPSVRKEVHFYDKLAESLETTFGLKWPKGLKQHPDWPEWLDDRRAYMMFDWARSRKMEDYIPVFDRVVE